MFRSSWFLVHISSSQPLLLAIIIGLNTIENFRKFSIALKPIGYVWWKSSNEIKLQNLRKIKEKIIYLPMISILSSIFTIHHRLRSNYLIRNKEIKQLIKQKKTIRLRCNRCTKLENSIDFFSMWWTQCERYINQKCLIISVFFFDVSHTINRLES